MRINVVLLGQYRLAAESQEFTLELPGGLPASAAVAEVKARSLADIIPDKPVIAVNRVHATLDDVLHDGDELALLPPVAGG